MPISLLRVKFFLNLIISHQSLTLTTFSLQAAAQELELVQTSKFGGGVGSASREDSLRSAATLHLQLGNLQRHCELLIELGEWDRALALAPGVSHAYWHSLAQRRADALLAADDDAAIAVCVATGRLPQLVEWLGRRRQLHDALLIALAGHEGTITASPPLPAPRSRHNGIAVGDEEEHMKLVQDASAALADWYFRNGSPVLAACCHLAIDDCQVSSGSHECNGLGGGRERHF